MSVCYSSLTCTTAHLSYAPIERWISVGTNCSGGTLFRIGQRELSPGKVPGKEG